MLDDDYPNYAREAHEWAQQVATEGPTELAALLGPGLRAISYALLDVADSIRGAADAVVQAMTDS